MGGRGGANPQSQSEHKLNGLHLGHCQNYARYYVLANEVWQHVNFVNYYVP